MVDNVQNIVTEDDNKVWLSVPGFWNLPRSKYIAELISQEFWKMVDPSKTGQSGLSSNGAYTEITFDTDKVQSKFRIWNIPNSLSHDLTASISCDSESIEDAKAFWCQVLTRSIERVQSEPESYPWECVIGPLPDPFSSVYKIINPIMMGGLFIEVASTQTWEMRSGLSHGLTVGAGGTIFETWPVWLRGSADTYYEFETTSLALADANVASLILTLAMNQAWAPRYQPQRHEDHLLRIPQYADTAQQLKDDNWPPANYVSQAVEIDLSDWCEEAWDLLQKQSSNKIRKAIYMFREGIMLAQDHPSMARVAFVAATEALPKPRPKRCDSCSSPIGLTDAFKDAIGLTDSPYWSEILGAHYKDRSRTVHDGKVSERELSSNLSSFMRDPRDLKLESPVGMIGYGTLRTRVRELILDKLRLDDPLPTESQE